MQTIGQLTAMCLALIGGPEGRAGHLGRAPAGRATASGTADHEASAALRLSAEERRLIKALPPADAPHAGPLRATREAILRGEDPLGDAFSAIHTAKERRATGAVYTPLPIVQSMVRWVADQGRPARVVDPGAGSGRFLVAAGHALPDAHLIGIEKDPLAALMLRANLAVHGLWRRASVVVKDYREARLPRCEGMTAFVGNPPYVRHHDIEPAWKAWYAERFSHYGIRASALAGLHLHFFLQTRALAHHGDVGAFITSAEWLDVNYGSALRSLLIDELGGVGLHVLAPTVEAFPGTATTAAITCFRVGEQAEPVRVRAVARLSGLNGLSQGRAVPRMQLQDAPRWSIIVRPSAAPGHGEMELGELFRVHRGQVTGANSVWIDGEHARKLPERVKMPAVTKAKDLIEAGAQLHSAHALRRVIDLPPQFDGFSKDEQRHIRAFLAWAQAQGVHEGYIARHRRAWWSVGLKAPAPILCTYMARRAPQFTLNRCEARHINIAHGLYPREALPDAALGKLVAWLNAHVHTDAGRTYAGGLTKFEPKEIERLHIPTRDLLGL